MSRLKLLKLSTVAAVLFATSAFAQRDDGYFGYQYEHMTRSITVQPIDLFSGVANIEYEHALAPWFSLYGGIDFLAFRGALNVDYDHTLVIGPEVGARFYLIGDAPRGLWLGPYIGAAYVDNTYNGVSSQALGFGVGAMAGINFVIRWFNLSLGAGTGWIDYRTDPDGHPTGLYGFVPRLRVAVGVVF